MNIYLLTYTWFDKEYGRQKFGSKVFEADYSSNATWEIEMRIADELPAEAKYADERAILSLSKI